MRIAGPALHVSLLLVSGSVLSVAFVGCASPTGTNAPQDQVDARDPVSTRDAGANRLAAEDVVERAGAPASGQDEDFGQATELLTLREQKERLLLQAALTQAREFQSRGQFDQALEQANYALSIDENNREAQRLQDNLQAMLGRGPGERGVSQRALQEQVQVRLDQVRLKVREDLNDAKLALARGDYDAAIAELSIAKTNIEVNGFDIDWGGMDEEVTQLLEQTRDERESAQAAQRREEQQRAFEELQAIEARELSRQEQLVSNLLRRAIAAFDARDYDEAENLARKVDRLDPGNARAEELRTAAFRASRQAAKEEYIEKKNEKFKDWDEELERMMIPRTSIITLTDPDDWREKSEKRQSRMLDPTMSMSPLEADLRERVATESVQLPPIEDVESLDEVIGYIRNNTGLPMIVDPAAETYVLDEVGEPFNFDFANALTVEQALNRIVDAAGGEDAGVTWTVRYDAIFITTQEKALGMPVTRVHEVKDLTFALTDFVGPRINRIRLLDELEDEDGGTPFGTVFEAQQIIEAEDLMTLIRDTIAPASWDRDNVGMEPGEGNLIVRQTEEIQVEIQNFLEDLRQFNSALVLIESKFLSVTDNFIQEIGNDFRGLDNRVLEDVTNGLEDMASRGLDNGGSGTSGTNAAGSPSAGYFFDDGPDGAFAATTQNFFGTALGNSLSTIGGLTFQMTFLDDSEVSAILRAVEKSERSQVVQSQMLSVHDSQRAYVTVINQRAYIQDFDVEVAQFQAVADPTVNVLSEGIVLDVRPTILDNRKWLRLEIQPTVAKIVNLRSFSTTLGGNTAPVEFQLPELEVQSVNTSAFLPDGGSLLLGGLSRIRNVERRAEVPWIGRVPLLGFLFKQEGYNDERESLMIMVRATITDGREKVRTELESGY